MPRFSALEPMAKGVGLARRQQQQREPATTAVVLDVSDVYGGCCCVLCFFKFCVGYSMLNSRIFTAGILLYSYCIQQ